MEIWRNDEKFIRLQTHLLTVHAQFLTTYNVCDVDCACTSANVTTVLGMNLFQVLEKIIQVLKNFWIIPGKNTLRKDCEPCNPLLMLIIPN